MRIFRSPLLGGFECSTHRRADGVRLDMIAATRHDELADADYARLRGLGIRAARDGFRWHLIEEVHGRYDFSSALPLVRAARDAGVQVVWDLCHYGWPDDVDVFSASFVERFAEYARAAAMVVAAETDEETLWIPINEIGYLAWAGGDIGYLNPFATGRGLELKMQLVRALIAATDAIRSVDASSRVATAEPCTSLVSRLPDDLAAVRHRDWECETWDMLSGRRWAEIGGAPRYLDLIGVNYYPTNQFFEDDTRVFRDDPLYRPLREILSEIAARYDRPMFIGETSAGGDDRPAWLSYVASEAREAASAGVQLEAVCLYPIIDHPHWDATYPLEVGVWSYADEAGARGTHGPYASQIAAELSAWAVTEVSVKHPERRREPSARSTT